MCRRRFLRRRLPSVFTPPISQPLTPTRRLPLVPSLVSCVAPPLHPVTSSHPVPHRQGGAGFRSIGYPPPPPHHPTTLPDVTDGMRLGGTQPRTYTRAREAEGSAAFVQESGLVIVESPGDREGPAAARDFLTPCSPPRFLGLRDKGKTLTGLAPTRCLRSLATCVCPTWYAVVKSVTYAVSLLRPCPCAAQSG